MSPQSPALSPKPKKSGTVDAQAVKDFFTQLKALASAVGFDAVVSIHNENNKLRDQVSTKDQEIGRLQSEMAALEKQKTKELRELAESNKEKMSERDKTKGIALNVMFEHNEKERTSHKQTQDRVHSLEHTIKEKETLISQQNRNTDELKEQVDNLKLDNANQRGQLSKAQKDYNILQQQLKERDATIDAMKATGAGLEGRLSASNKKIKEMEADSRKLQKTLAETKAHLAKIEGFAAGHMETNEDSL